MTKIKNAINTICNMLKIAKKIVFWGFVSFAIIVTTYGLFLVENKASCASKVSKIEVSESAYTIFQSKLDNTTRDFSNEDDYLGINKANCKIESRDSETVITYRCYVKIHYSAVNVLGMRVYKVASGYILLSSNDLDKGYVTIESDSLDA
jgi:hypothetical protein